jgi:inorganic pyrophosphatase
MLRLIILGLAVAVFAQETTIRPKDDLVTGGKQEYRKVIKGSLEKPADFKVYIEKAADSSPLSYWHDIPMSFDETKKIYNVVIKDPRGVDLKMSMNTSEEMNPIRILVDQDGKALRENVAFIHNFGKLPQTFSDDQIIDTLAKLKGTGKPLDVVEISETTHRMGDVVPAKILGSLGVVDNNVINWVLIAFDTNSPMSDEINTLADVESHFPDLLEATRGYFRFYRFPQQVNDILFEGHFQDADTTAKLIAEKNDAWRKLLELDTPPEGIVTDSHQVFGVKKADDAAWKKTYGRIN